MSGTAAIHLDAEEVTAIPESSLIRDGLEQYVFVEESSTSGVSEYRRRNIVPGRREPGWVEVHGGLYPGDRVVTVGAHELSALFIPGVLRPSEEAQEAIGLRVATVRQEVIEEVLEVDGVVDLPVGKRGSASSPMPGLLASILVGPEQAVRAGEMIAEVRSQELLAQQIDLLRLHLESRLLEDTLKQWKSSGRDSVSWRRLVDVETQARSVRLRVDEAKQKLKLAGLDERALDDLLAKQVIAPTVPVRAPLSGMVVSFTGQLGQAVKAETPLFTIHDASNPLIRVPLSESEAAQVSAGQEARVRIPSNKDFLAREKVRTVTPSLDSSRASTAWVEGSSPAPELLVGGFARVSLTLKRSPSTLAVAVTAIVRQDGDSFVFVRRPDGRFERRRVQPGRSDDRWVEIRSGLKEGEPVAVRGTEALATAHAGIR